MKADPDAWHRFPRGLTGVVLGLAVLTQLAARGSPEAPERDRAFEPKAFDPGKSPLVAVPPSRYEGGDLVPAAILGDSTSFNLDSSTPTPADPFWHDLDVEDGYLFAATGLGLDVYDVSNPDAPQLLARASAPELAPSWEDLGQTFYLESLDVPAGDASLVVTAAREQGLIVWDVRDKSRPTVHYQDGGGLAGVIAPQVYTAFLGEQRYAFVPSPGNGLLYYNLTVAATYNGCLESTLEDDIRCPGVFAGATFRTTGASWVHGIEEFLVVRTFSRDVVILDVSDPDNADTRLAGQLPGPGEQVAMWSDAAGSLYLGAVGAAELWIYDVTCIRNGDCALPARVATVPVPDASVEEEPTLTLAGGQRFLSVSRSGPTPFLYVGNDNFDTVCVAQREYLFDLTDPRRPRDVTPQVDRSGYWGWYYDACFTGSPGGPGFNYTRPRRGKLHGDRFYRAGFSFLDSHRYVVELAADFIWRPATPLTGETVELIDTSAGNPDSWSWDFPGGGVVDSLEQNPTWVFDTAGPQAVTLTVANESGSVSVTKTVTVTERPPPPVADFTWVPQVPEIGQRVILTSTSTGNQDFWHWRFENATKQMVSGSLRVHRTVRLTFLQAGMNAVELWVAGTTGVGYVKKYVKVIPPEPVIEGVTVEPTSVEECSPVTFTAAVTGRVPLTYEWSDPTDPGTVASKAATFVWNVPDVDPGPFTSTLTVSNALGASSATSPPVEVVAIGPLRITTPGGVPPGGVPPGGVPLVEEQRGANVTFRIDTENAREWNWHWGDEEESGWTSDEARGTNPTYFYSAPAGGRYLATVEVRNCVEGPIVSLPVTVDVAPFEPLEIVVFEAVCPFGFCAFETQQPITFEHEVTGFPQTYLYDWDGNGSFEESSTEPVLTHAYTRAGRFRPVLRVVRGSESVQAVEMSLTVLIVK